jgi:glycine/D-amino acid oxidase-like deaminating enzyme
VSVWRDAEPAVFWLDRPDAPEPSAPLAGHVEADLAIVGGGFTGLWAAALAKEEDPSRDVVLVEAGTIAFGGSGRNGGFAMSTLTHGLENGEARFGHELDRIEAEAKANLAAIGETVERYAIDCDWTPSGEIEVAREPHQLAWAAEAAERYAQHGYDVALLDRDAIRAEVDSPTFLGAWWNRSGCAMVDPARLAWGLARVARDLGVRVHEGTSVTGLLGDGLAVRLRTPGGSVRSPRVLLATNGYPPLVRAVGRAIVPVYDHVLMTEPLSAAQRAAVGWANRQGFADMTNRFHYFRITQDDRILWGGYDAVYHWRSGVDPRFEDRPATYDALERNFFETFPQLEGLGFSHRWAGVIDTCTRFSVFFHRAFDGRVVSVAGYTGMGVAASRFGARVGLELLDDRDTARTRLDLVRSRPLPFPPEPLRSVGIGLTVRALARADRSRGRRGPWLRLMDALGLGFDS